MLEPDDVRAVMTKWGGKPHWEFDARHLGEDAHGVWLGVEVGTVMSRPGARFVAEFEQVVLVPRPGAGGGAGWMATFHAPGFAVATYVDMTSVPRWSADRSRVSAVDLDLDVVRMASDGSVYVDDEDEFAEHRVAYGYPSEVVSLAEASCAFVLSEVRAERAPFDAATPAGWLRALADLPERPRP